MPKFWDFIKNIGALIALIWVLVQVYNFFSQRGHKLEAEIDTNKFVLPVDFQNLVDYKKTNFFDVLKDSLERSPNHKLVSLIDSFLQKSFIKEFEYSGVRNNFCSIVTLKNSGDKEAKNIQLLTNGSSAIFQFVDNNEKGLYGLAKKIEIGNLLPSEKITLYLWHGLYEEEDFHITFAEGNVNLEYGTKLYGFAASIGYFFSNWISIVILFFVIVFILQTKNIIDIFLPKKAANENNKPALKEENEKSNQEPQVK